MAFTSATDEKHPQASSSTTPSTETSIYANEKSSSQAKTTIIVQENLQNEASASIDATSIDNADTPSEELVRAIEKFIDDNELDPNFPQDLLNKARQFLEDRNSAVVDLETAQNLMNDFQEQKDLAENHSPYPEVRAVVDPTDDPTQAVATFRVFVLGTFFCIVGTAIQEFFSLRMPSIDISTYVVQLLSMPLGVMMAKYLPARKFGPGRFAISLNPGEFTQKEHILIAVMANVSFGGNSTGAYITSVIQVLKLDRFYGEKVLANNIPWQICSLLATQLMGYGCAGMTRRFLVYPPAMIWQRALANIALTKALYKDHGHDSQPAVNGWTMSRYRFFTLAFGSMFAYYWIPNYLFQGVALFNWTTWIAPTSVTLAIITGSTCGLGLSPLPTLDWNIATYLGEPIVTPLFTHVNFAAGMALMGFVVAPLMYFNNVWNGGHLPINTNKIYDNTGEVYNVHRILHANMTLNEEAYQNYSIPWFSTTQVLNFVGLFTMYASIPVYNYLYFRKAIVSGIKSLAGRKKRNDEFTDVHNRLMSAYKECPHWWYLSLLAFSFILACVSVTQWPTGMPIWGIVVALLVTVILQIPVGMLTAITNVEIPTSILTTALGGYALEGKAVPNMIFKMFSYMATAQSLNFVADLKLAHYAKIPPRWAFIAQVYATILAGFVSLGVNHWVLRNVPDVCVAGQKERFTCPHAYTFFKASVVWGVIGPRRLFGPGGPYAVLTYLLPVGFVLPLIVYCASKRWPKSWLRNVVVPIFLAGPLGWAPFNWGYMQGTVVLAIFFNFFIKRRYKLWWERYAYVLSSSFMAGIGLAGLAMFFMLQKWNIRVDWWGNSIAGMGVDQAGVLDQYGNPVKCVNLPLPPGGKFETGF